MPIAVYMDVHIPMAVTESLRRRGLDVLTSQEDGKSQADDDSLLARAVGLRRVLLTQDQDFLRITAAWQQEGRTFPGVVFAAQQGVSIGLLTGDLELLLTCCEPEELSDRVTYLPLRQ